MSKYSEIEKYNEENLAALYDRLVPDSGMADTVAGEILRAANRIIYRYFNDGDMVGIGYGNETCNSSYRYLYSQLKDKCPCLTSCSETEYEERLLTLLKNIKEFLDSSPEILEKHNTEDSRTPDPEDLNYDDDDDCYCYDGYDDYGW